jgi:hypothetical protein
MTMRKGEVTEQAEHNGFIISAHDPYGFWYVTRKGTTSGSIPTDLRQAFTSRHDAMKAIDAVILRKDLEAKKLEEEMEPKALKAAKAYDKKKQEEAAAS